MALDHTPFIPAHLAGRRRLARRRRRVGSPQEWAGSASSQMRGGPRRGAGLWEGGGSGAGFRKESAGAKWPPPNVCCTWVSRRGRQAGSGQTGSEWGRVWDPTRKAANSCLGGIYGGIALLLLGVSPRRKDLSGSLPSPLSTNRYPSYPASGELVE